MSWQQSMQERRYNMTEPKIIKSISLFANAGIGEYYLHEVGIKNVIANELLGPRCRFYKSIYPDCIVVPGSIVKQEIQDKLVELAEKERVELLTGSPPCQGTTVANGKKDKWDNPINRLIIPTLAVIKRIPTLKYVFLENAENWFISRPTVVPELKGRNIEQFLIDELTSYGYKFIHTQIMDAADYGLPQHRRRSILIASKEKDWLWPEKEKQIPLKDVIFHLPSLEAGECSDLPFHNGPKWNPRVVNIMRHTAPGCSAWNNTNPKYQPVKKDGTVPKKYRSAYTRNNPDKPCGAVLMKSAANGGMITCHPGRSLGLDKDGDPIYSDARPFTIRELLIICGLGEDYPVPAFAVNNERLIRDVLGECLSPQLMKRIMAKIPR